MRRILISLLLPVALPSACGDKESAASSASDSSDDVTAPAFRDVLTADQIGQAVGGPVTLKTGPFDSCEFTQDDARALSGSIGTTAVDDSNGGYEGYVSGTKMTLSKPMVHELAGLGESAFFTTGTFGGGENLQGAGGALVGNLVITVNLAPGNGLADADVTEAGTKLLTLAVGAV